MSFEVIDRASGSPQTDEPRKSTSPGAQSQTHSSPTPAISPAQSQDGQAPSKTGSKSPGASPHSSHSHHTPAGSPARRKSTDPANAIAPNVSAIIPIDPALLDLDMAAGELTAKPQQTQQAQIHVQTQDKADNLTAADRAASNTDGLLVETPRDIRPSQLPWSLDTHGIGTTSQPATSSSESPATPLGIDGLYHGSSLAGENSTDLSRQSSVSDFQSFLGAEKGISTTASSESGYDDEAYNPALAKVEEGGGIPPPRPKKSHARKQPEGHIKRARNAFILFRKHITDSNLIPPSVEVKHQNISVVAAKMWREAPQEVRAKFQEQARIEKEEHQRKYPGYRYQPIFRRTDIIRRRVRKDQAEDEKVEAVAEALIQGKSGEKLEEEIRDQMVARSVEIASESEAESVRPEGSGSDAGGGRRRRRDVGQLSKGAMRAQRAQARAKQMRQNLLGSNLLNMSLYNASQQQQQHQLQLQQGRGMPNHPGAQHLQYTMGVAGEGYLPSMGYEIDPRSHGHGGHPHAHGGMYADQHLAHGHVHGHGAGHPHPHGVYAPGMEMDANEMYRLPPIDGVGVGMGGVGGMGMGLPGGMGGGMGMAYDHHQQQAHAWPGQPGPSHGQGQEQGEMEYWTNAGPSEPHHPNVYDPMNGSEYHAAEYQEGYYPPMQVLGDVGDVGDMRGMGHMGHMRGDIGGGEMRDVGEYDASGAGMMHQYQLPPLIDPSALGSLPEDLPPMDMGPGLDEHGQHAQHGQYGQHDQHDQAAYGSHPHPHAHPHPHEPRSHEPHQQPQPQQQQQAHGTEGSADTRMHEWGGEGQQTPSGHVMFNERLFDGALGSAGLPTSLLDGGRDDGLDHGLAGFEEAMAQAADLGQW